MNYLHHRNFPQWLIFGGLIGCGLIALAVLVYAIKNNQERSRANFAVEAEVAEAESLAEQKRFDEAIRLMEEAVTEPKATNTAQAVQTLQHLRGMKDTALKSGKQDEAKQLVQESKIPQALETIREPIPRHCVCTG